MSLFSIKPFVFIRPTTKTCTSCKILLFLRCFYFTYVFPGDKHIYFNCIELSETKPASLILQIPQYCASFTRQKKHGCLQFTEAFCIYIWFVNCLKASRGRDNRWQELFWIHLKQLCLEFMFVEPFIWQRGEKDCWTQWDFSRFCWPVSVLLLIISC